MNLIRETTTDKIEMMREYIKVVEEELKQKQKKVENQKEQVKEAEKSCRSRAARNAKKTTRR